MRLGRIRQGPVRDAPELHAVIQREKHNPSVKPILGLKSAADLPEGLSAHEVFLDLLEGHALCFRHKKDEVEDE